MLRHCIRFKNVKCLLGYSPIINQAQGVGKMTLASAVQLDNPKTTPIISIQTPGQRDLNDASQLIPSQEINSPLVVDPTFEGVSPIASASFNLASLVNKSELLQLMVKLGVSIDQWERKGDVHEWVMTLNFQKDVQPIIQFLVDQGVIADCLGRFFTKNPYILKSSIEDLEIRTNYLRSKKFSTEMISRILSRNPHWLLFR